MKKLISNIDRSVNFVFASGFESRYVRRTDEYFIVYLSSHSGCNKSCRFCHLTQTGQTEYTQATLGMFIMQAAAVFKHYSNLLDSGKELPAEKVHFNWMARGEPLDNNAILYEWPSIVKELSRMAHEVGIFNIEFNISTIIPKSFSGELSFGGDIQPNIYYSLYSIDNDFRKKWLPKASDPAVSISLLRDWQVKFGGKIILHWAFIDGENDSISSIDNLVEFVKNSNISAKFNLVRYNPFSSGQGEESSIDIIEKNYTIIKSVMTVSGSRIVPRVGFDVKASCGMFVNKE